MQNHLIINGMGLVLLPRKKQNVEAFVFGKLSLKVLSPRHYWEMVELLRTGDQVGALGYLEWSLKGP